MARFGGLIPGAVPDYKKFTSQFMDLFREIWAHPVMAEVVDARVMPNEDFMQVGEDDLLASVQRSKEQPSTP